MCVWCNRETRTGFPQGSVLSLMLFCLLINDNNIKQIGSQSVKFADNWTVWRTGLEVIKLVFILRLKI